MRALGLACFVIAACASPRAKHPQRDVLPINDVPKIARASGEQPKNQLRVELSVTINRNITLADDVAFVVRFAKTEVGRYPIVGTLETTRRGVMPFKVRQLVELPLGDYEIEVAYRGFRYAGQSFRIAEVPVWGGARRIQLIYHQGTAVNLQDRRLHLARWWADDMPTQPWIVEWRHEGLPVTITSGREAPWRTSNAKSLVGFAHHAINNNVEAHSLWRLGEEYAIPEMVATKPGLWQARIVRSGSAPVAVSFSVLPGGGLANLSGRLIYRRGGWRDVVSAPLRLESVPDAEVLQLAARVELGHLPRARCEAQASGRSAPARPSPADRAADPQPRRTVAAARNPPQLIGCTPRTARCAKSLAIGAIAKW